ncbi:MAG: substrate-binding domain-containing protein [bacterium]
MGHQKIKRRHGEIQGRKLRREEESAPVLRTSGSQSDKKNMGGGNKIAILGMVDGANSRYWKLIEDGAAAAAAQRSITVEYHRPQALGERNVAQWQSKIAETIANDPEVKAVGLSMIDPAAGAKSIETLSAAGIPCVTFDSDVPNSNRAFFIGANNRAAGRTCAFTVAKLISFKGKIIIDSPSYKVNSCVERIGGFKDAIGRYSGIEVVGEVGGDESAASIKYTAEKTAATPGLVGIFCASGGSAKADAEALKKAGLAGKVALVCVNVDAEIRELLKKGVIHMAIGQRPYSIGFRLVDYLDQIARNGIDMVMRGIPSSRIADTGMHQVTRDNIESYVDTLEKMQRDME